MSLLMETEFPKYIFTKIWTVSNLTDVSFYYLFIVTTKTTAVNLHENVISKKEQNTIIVHCIQCTRH